MTTNLTESERDVWKKTYMLHEKYHDIDGTDAEWARLLTDIKDDLEMFDGSEHRLAYKIMMALYDYFSDEVRDRWRARREQPEQVTMEDIPWS